MATPRPVGGYSAGRWPVGQKKQTPGLIPQIYQSNASGSFTVTDSGYALIYAWGGGGGGNSGGGGAGGAGGGAVYKRFAVAAGQVISFTVGAGGAAQVTGGDTTVTLPSGKKIIATGGTGNGSAPAGTGIGGDLNRTGGMGGQSGEFGGATAGGPTEGGGGAAGFSDIANILLLGGDGNAAPGGGGSGNSGGAGTAGQGGRVIIILVSR